MFRIRDLKNDVIVEDNIETKVLADAWLRANVRGPDEEGSLEVANVMIEEY